MSRLEQIRRDCKRIRERHYPAHSRPGGTVHARLAALARPDAVLLDIGCGRSAAWLRFEAPAFARAYGIDPEIPAEMTEGNITLLRGGAEVIPLPDQSVDVIMSINALEHLADPQAVLSECRRVLRPCGNMLILVPNVLYPPLMLGRLLPHRARTLVNKWATGTAEEDTFPARYRANSVGRLKRLAREARLDIIRMEHVLDHPRYLTFSTWAYRLGMWIDRALLRRQRLAFLRHSIFCHLQSPAAQPAPAVWTTGQEPRAAAERGQPSLAP